MSNARFDSPARTSAKRALLAVALAALASVLPPALATAAEALPNPQMPPQELVKTVSTQVLDDIKADPQLHAGDIEKLQRLVDTKVAPYVDFERMTRLSVGRGWRNATPEQRQELMRQFRTLLVRTYSGAFTRVTDQKVVMRPFREESGASDVIVRSDVTPSNGEGVELDYRMEKSPAGWKIYDVIIVGVSLVENFRTSFANEISAGGVPGLISALEQRNRQLASGQNK